MKWKIWNADTDLALLEGGPRPQKPETVLPESPKSGTAFFNRLSGYGSAGLKLVAAAAALYTLYRLAKYLNDRRIARLEMERLSIDEAHASAGQEGAAPVHASESSPAGS